MASEPGDSAIVGILNLFEDTALVDVLIDAMTLLHPKFQRAIERRVDDGQTPLQVALWVSLQGRTQEGVDAATREVLQAGAFAYATRVVETQAALEGRKAAPTRKDKSREVIL